MSAQQIQATEKDEFIQKDMVLQTSQIISDAFKQQLNQDQKDSEEEEKCQGDSDNSSSHIDKGEEEILDFSISDKVDLMYLEKSRSVIIEKPNEEDQSQSSINFDQSKLEFSQATIN